MQTFKVSKNSWHYYLVANTSSSYDMPTDFCSYWRRVVISALFLCLSVIALLVIFGLLLYALGAWLYLLIVSPTDAAIAAASLFVVIAIITSPIWIGGLITKAIQRKSKDIEKQPSLVATRYKSWKHKYCPAIDYEK